MIELTLSTIAKVTDGQLLGKDRAINRLSTDTRTTQVGDIFLALRGTNFDGHKFVGQAEGAGCGALIVDHQVTTTLPQVVVSDTLIALGKLGAYVKAVTAPKTVAITGSSGKTTVKEMVAAILSRLGNVLATQGNFNNDIGVPLTLLRLKKAHDFAVIELGANHLGEIAYTTSLVKPDVAIINNIAAAHLEGFGDLCGVARAKGEIYQGLNEAGVALYNQDCQYANKWQWRLTDKKVKRFSCHREADCYSTDVMLDDNGYASFKLHTDIGSTFINLQLPGKHNVCNAVAAAAIALEFGASLQDIQLGLAEMAPVKGRSNLHHLGDEWKLIDDTYNANVESIKAAIDLLANYPGRKVLILGDMGELGSEARSYHQEVGEYAGHTEIDELLTIGVLSQSTSDAFERLKEGKGHHFSDREKLMGSLQSLLRQEQQQVSILVKGSRSAHMEYVVNDIIEWRDRQITEDNF